MNSNVIRSIGLLIGAIGTGLFLKFKRVDNTEFQRLTNLDLLHIERNMLVENMFRKIGVPGNEEQKELETRFKKAEDERWLEEKYIEELENEIDILQYEGFRNE